MNGLITTNLQENEIVKASDLQLGGDNGIENLEKFFAALSLAKKNVVIGGKLTAYQTGTGLAAKMEPVIGYNYTTKKMFADHEGKVYMEGDETSSDYITFMAADSSRRRDIVEVKADVITAGEQTRQFYNPETEETSYAVTNIEKIQILRCKVKKGTPGSDTAPTTDNGYVKIAEVVIDGNITQLENTNILNISANIDEENSEWSVEKNSVVNPGTLQDHQNTFRKIHKSDGTLENEVVKAANILLSGTGSLNGSNILKGGNTTSVENQQIAPSDSIAESIVKIASAIANHADKTGSNTHGATSSAIANKIMIRDSSGKSQVAAPTEDNDITNKKYLEETINTVKQALYNSIHPVGYVYHQLPGTPSPIEMGLYGTWEEIKYGGVFFRAAGDNSLPFTGNFKCAISGTTVILDSTDQKTIAYETALAEETATNLIVVAGGECRAITAWIRGTHTITIDSAFDATNITNVLIGQCDQLQGHKHWFSADGRNEVSTMWGQRSWKNDGGSGGAMGTVTMQPSLKTDGINGTPRTGNETRAKNLSVVYWKRTA